MENLNKKVLKENSYFETVSSNKSSYLNASKLVISDCDGVLTDGNSVYTKSGKKAKMFGAYDTEMITFMKTQGWEFLFVSRDPSGIDITKARISDMHSELSVLNGAERAELVKNMINKRDVVLFVGDSLSDIKAMSNASYSACTANSVRQVKEYADYISEVPGGHGALGEILMWIHLKLS